MNAKHDKSHYHACVVCGHKWKCEDSWLHCMSTGTFKAAQVNKQGPYCLLCSSLIMAIRYAELRGFEIQLRFVKKKGVVKYGSRPKERDLQSA